MTGQNLVAMPLPPSHSLESATEACYLIKMIWTWREVKTLSHLFIRHVKHAARGGPHTGTNGRIKGMAKIFVESGKLLK